VLPTFGTLLASSVALLSAVQDGDVGRLVLVGSTDEPCAGGTPASPYSAAKAAMTAYAKLYAEAFAAPVVCVRPSETFGPGQAPTKLLPYAAAAVLRGERPRLTSGTRRGDWIYVDDVVDGLLAAARDAPDGAEVDLGTGRLRSNREVVEGLLAALGTDVRPLWGRSWTVPASRSAPPTWRTPSTSSGGGHGCRWTRAWTGPRTRPAARRRTPTRPSERAGV
jgi:UDP-glucose 4-epimerase